MSKPIAPHRVPPVGRGDGPTSRQARTEAGAPLSRDTAANTEVQRALVSDAYDEDRSPLTCARDLARAGVRGPTDDEP